MATQPEDRPSPQALLEQAKKEGRGKFKIFLGAAPGVGKTYEMLTQARRRRLDGTDVVIGVVETHGRIETDALTKGFEAIPKKRSLYRGRVIAEMDLDAVLQRKPQLVLVDELAHTNAEDSRHPKRYLDVEELLAAGIDVYSTVNIQHIESLNDVIAQITRIHVRETVPDEVLDEADEIELVDTTSDDLLQRLREGKVYVKAQAERALRHFFSPGNLTALRELALRKTAQHVDRNMTDYMQAHGIGGPWPAGEHILVCVNENPSSAELVRRARRLADSVKASWTALYIESPRHTTLNEIQKDRVADTMRLAQRLGAESVTLPGRDIGQTLLKYARESNVTQILIGKSERSRWFEILHGSVVRDLMRESGAISVTAVLAEGEAVAPKTVKTSAVTYVQPWRDYALSALTVALTVGFALIFDKAMAHAVGSVGMLFLVPVLLSAVTFGLRPALFTAVLSALAYNFFFLPPLYTLTISDPNNLLSFTVLLFVAIIGGNLAARVRAQADIASARARITAELYSFAGKLAGIAHLDDILWAAAFQIASMLKANVVVLLPDATTGRPEIRAGYPPEDELDTQDLAAAGWCWDHATAAGHNAETLPGAKRLFLPMRTGAGLVGIIGLQKFNEKTWFTPDERRLLDALIDQSALAIERSQLVERIDEAQVHLEADKLRVAMLTSLSHDLRTPLASILGSATTLLTNRNLYDAAQTDELLATIRDEGERLDRFVGNLLDMSRLEAGALGVKLEDIDVSELVETATKRLARRLSDHSLILDMPGDLPLGSVDPLLLEQTIVNLLDNAAKYAPAASRIHVGANLSGDRVLLTIADEGPGIPPDALAHIFDKFYRAKAADRRVAGTGLGLAVARGFVEAFGGRLDAANRTDRSGAVLTISLPLASKPVGADGR
ncbi:MAG TPA: sensor histidine kinase KdpD [Rhizomicrobium sp.]